MKRGAAELQALEEASRRWDCVWVDEKWLPERRGQRCRVLMRRQRKNLNRYVIGFRDGYRVTTFYTSFRRCGEAAQ